MPKRSNAQEDRSPSPSSRDTRPRKRTQSGDQLKTADLSMTAEPRSSGSTAHQASNALNQTIPPCVDQRKTQTEGLALPPPSAANERRLGALTDPGFDPNLPSWDLFKVVPDSDSYLYRVYYGFNPPRSSSITSQQDALRLTGQADAIEIATTQSPLRESNRDKMPMLDETESNRSSAPQPRNSTTYSQASSPCGIRRPPIHKDHCDRCYREGYDCYGHSPECVVCREDGLKCTYTIRDWRNAGHDQGTTHVPAQTLRRCDRCDSVKKDCGPHRRPCENCVKDGVDCINHPKGRRQRGRSEKVVSK